jgi:cyanophycinase
MIIDQHFRERDRVGRLVTMVSYNPGLLGLGIDEDTAALITPDGTLEVLGRGTVLLRESGTTSTDDRERRHSLRGRRLPVRPQRAESTRSEVVAFPIRIHTSVAAMCSAAARSSSAVGRGVASCGHIGRRVQGEQQCQ